MSADDSPGPRLQSDKDVALPAATHSQKSYRRKYRKIMVKFERQMRESTALFKDQQRMLDISQRIAEQNDQILNLLLELNSHPQVPARLRYGLNDSLAREPDRHQDQQESLEKLRTTRHAVQKGDVQYSNYEDLSLGLLDTVEFAPRISYANIAKGGVLGSGLQELEDTTGTGGFLSSKQEEDYKHSLDEYIDHKASNPRAHVVGSLGHRSTEKSVEREREAQLKNPVSVYNWLRKNQPQVFLQDVDNDKSKTASRASKRASTNKVKTEPDMYDEDGIALEPSTARGKRKRDEDGGYRPKGGHARPIKRRKEESGRRSKRASMDISTS